MKKRPKLVLHRETLRSLSAQRIAGGVGSIPETHTWDATCHSEFPPCGSGIEATLSDVHLCFSDTNAVHCIDAY